MSFIIVIQVYNCKIFKICLTLLRDLEYPSKFDLLLLNQLVTEGCKSVQKGVKKYTNTGLGVCEPLKKEFWKLVNPDPSYRHFFMTEFWS